MTLRDMRDFSYDERMTTPVREHQVSEPPSLATFGARLAIIRWAMRWNLKEAGSRRLDSGTVVQDTAHLTLSADSGFSGAVVCPECLRSSATPGDQPTQSSAGAKRTTWLPRGHVRRGLAIRP